MCGIAGILNHTARKGTKILGHYIERLRQRGPDDNGIWQNREGTVVLGNTRLAVIDISPAGHQPMLSHDGRYVIVYNGEIYNFREIRSVLEEYGIAFRSNSDTEVILAAISRWGIEAAVKKFNGMFAFGLWDDQERRLHLVRDRMGIKPLYYGWIGSEFTFASDLGAIETHPAFTPEINRDALALFLRFNYVPTPFCIYKGFHKLPPGSILSIQMEHGSESVQIEPFWRVPDCVASGEAARGSNISEHDAALELEELLKDSIGLRMISDVPLGAFLSGGVDSSTVVSLMQAHSTQAVKTFTIGYESEDYNEADHAREVAKHLGTDHHELLVRPKDAMDVIPRLPQIYSEPFSDPSQIPTYLVSRLTREHVTVSLSGDGGDELFAGYVRHHWLEKIWRRFGWMPPFMRRFFAGSMRLLSPTAWDRLFRFAGPLLTRSTRQRNAGDKIHKLADILPEQGPEAMYYGLASTWKNPMSMVTGSDESRLAVMHYDHGLRFGSITEKMMFLDQMTYLPDDILAKVDRASMAVSLEARVPLLDHRIVEFSWRLPLTLKLRDGQGKLVLRKILHKYVPREMIDRPKSGFGIPIVDWLRTDLRDWAEDLLAEKSLREEGFFDPEIVREKWREHLSGRRNWQYHLWAILMFRAWRNSK